MKTLFKGLNNNQLKLIAMLSMLLDHGGRELFPEIQLLPIIGRLAFPLFAYMIAEGCTYTKNRKKYFLIISILALGCQTVFFAATGSLYMNVLITFTLSIALIFLTDDFIKNRKPVQFISASTIWVLSVFLCIFLPGLLVDTDFKIDYGLAGLLLPAAVYSDGAVLRYVYDPAQQAQPVCRFLPRCGVCLHRLAGVF